MAIWIEAEGIYNILVDNCQIIGNGLKCIPDSISGKEENFRNGIVVDLVDDPEFFTMNLAVTRPGFCPDPPGFGFIRDVYENGILILTDGEAKLNTRLLRNKFPFKNHQGLNNLDIHGCVKGSGIKVVSGSTNNQSEIAVYDSSIKHNKGCGIEVDIMDGSVLNKLTFQGNLLIDNEGGEALVESCGGECLQVNFLNNVMGSPSADSAVGVLLRTFGQSNLHPSLIHADLEGNLIHFVNGNGLEIMAEDPNPDTEFVVASRKNRVQYVDGKGILITAVNQDQDALLKFESTNDRVCHNLGTGLDIDYMGPDNESLVDIRYMTCCDNGGSGILFGDVELFLNVVNSIFFDNGNYDVDLAFAGVISYSDWETGLAGGGSAYSVDCIDLHPLFLDLITYHIQYSIGNQSPCVDAGDDTAASGIDKDMEGDSRKIEVIPDPQRMDTDMGADEHNPG